MALNITDPCGMDLGNAFSGSDSYMPTDPMEIGLVANFSIED